MKLNKMIKAIEADWWNWNYDSEFKVFSVYGGMGSGHTYKASRYKSNSFKSCVKEAYKDLI